MHRGVTVDGRSVYNEQRQAAGYIKNYTDNPGDAQNFLQAWDPTPADKRRQYEIDSAVDTYRTDGKVQVIPHTGPITMAGPPSWPPIPPAYTPRPGTLVAIPWQEKFYPASSRQTQVLDRSIAIKRSAQVQRQWYWSNPGVIDNRGLDDSVQATFTTDRVGIPYRGKATTNRQFP